VRVEICVLLSNIGSWVWGPIAFVEWICVFARWVGGLDGYPGIWPHHKPDLSHRDCYLSTALEVGSSSVPLTSCASVRYMCYMPNVQCFQCRRKSIHDNNLQTHGKVSSSGLHSGQEGKKQKTRATWWRETRRIYATLETHPKELLVRLAQQTDVSASSARNATTLLH
jgi:hypothetical protein